MPWWIYVIGANLSIAVIEYIYRARAFDTYWIAFLSLLPIIFLVNFFVYNTYRHAPVFLLGWAFLMAGNTIARLVTNWYLGEAFNLVIFLGIATMLTGAGLVQYGTSN